MSIFSFKAILFQASFKDCNGHRHRVILKFKIRVIPKFKFSLILP